jgi:hypothetical protein
VSKICMQCDIAASCGLEVVLMSNLHQMIEVSNLYSLRTNYVLCFRMVLDVLKMLNKLRKNRILMLLKNV